MIGDYTRTTETRAPESIIHRTMTIPEWYRASTLYPCVSEYTWYAVVTMTMQVRHVKTGSFTVDLAVKIFGRKVVGGYHALSA